MKNCFMGFFGITGLSLLLSKNIMEAGGSILKFLKYEHTLD